MNQEKQINIVSGIIAGCFIFVPIIYIIVAHTTLWDDKPPQAVYPAAILVIAFFIVKPFVRNYFENKS